MRRIVATTSVALAFIVLIAASPVLDDQAKTPRDPRRIQVVSTLDGTMQDSYVIRPSGAETTAPRPLLVVLHTWGNTLESWSPTLEADTRTRDWIVLYPNFRGASDHPEACGSPLAQQDVLDAVTWVRANYQIDSSRIYVTGWSGGGFMTMLMAARHPKVWAAASAWSSITDLAEWYKENATGSIRAQLEGCFGGGPATSEAIGARYRDQSPLTYLRSNMGVPLDIGHGNQDSQVAVRHSLRAFAAVAPAGMSGAEIERFVASGFQNATPNTITDPLIAVRVLLRRTAGDVRLTIYEGEHGFYPRAAIEWMSAHQRR